MRKIDQLGHFWLPGNEDDALSGRIQFDPGDGGIRLTLVGTFNHVEDDGRQPTVRLYGWLGTDQVTLDRAFCTGTKWQSPGIAETSYYANRMFVGHHIEEDEPRFQTVRITLGYLDSWVGKTGIAEDRRFPHPPGTEPAYAMKFTPLSLETAAFLRGQLTMSFSWKPGGNSIEGITFKQWPVVSIEYDKLQPLDVIVNDISRLESLVTLCLDKLTGADTVTLSRPDVCMAMLDGSISELEQPIELLFPSVAYVDPLTRKRRHPYQMLLTYAELGGVEAVARWLDRSDYFAGPLNLIMSIRRAKFMFAENRFLNVAGAAEALHRLIIGGPHMDEVEFKKLFDAYLGARRWNTTNGSAARSSMATNRHSESDCNSSRVWHRRQPGRSSATRIVGVTPWLRFATS